MAEKTERPLLLGSVEIGSSIDIFEQTLSQSFHLAERWGAILLLEDVDSFLERGGSKESSLQAIFSKAIHAIENYSGILFLTTRRVGLLDEAVISRIDYTVRYNPLSPSAREYIWRTTLRYDSVNPDWERLGGIEGLNGTDIQSIVLQARQLASKSKEHLNMSDIDVVLKSRTDFIDYMAGVLGSKADSRAERSRFRHDRFDKKREES